MDEVLPHVCQLFKATNEEGHQPPEPLRSTRTMESCSFSRTMPVRRELRTRVRSGAARRDLCGVRVSGVFNPDLGRANRLGGWAIEQNLSQAEALR
jgi:hypothetical protein